MAVVIVINFLNLKKSNVEILIDNQQILVKGLFLLFILSRNIIYIF